MAQDPLNVLWIEPGFPGHLGSIADWFVRHRGYRCYFYCNSIDPKASGRWPSSVGDGLSVQSFGVGGVARESAVSWSQTLERSLCYAYGCAEVLEQVRPRPIDLIVGRSAGLGSSLFATVTYPRVPVVSLVEYYWHAHRNDLADDSGPSRPPAYYHWRRSANAIELLDLEQASLAWTRSEWQKGLFPDEYRNSIYVQHDGVDTRRFPVSSWHKERRGPREVSGRSIPPTAKVVSFVARSLERLRGFDRFWTIANELIRSDSDIVVIAIGAPVTTRGLDIEYHNRSLVEDLRARHPLANSDRVWLLGPSSSASVGELLAVSDLHLSPSRVYPVARSTLEAMSTGCVVLASDTPPHREVIEDGKSGLLLPGDDLDAWLTKSLEVLDDPATFRPLGEAASQLIRDRYSHDVCLSHLAERFNSLALG